jgi:hypothetical protein
VKVFHRYLGGDVGRAGSNRIACGGHACPSHRGPRSRLLHIPATHKFSDFDHRHRATRHQQRQQTVSGRERADLEHDLCGRDVVDSELHQHREQDHPEQPEIREHANLPEHAVVLRAANARNNSPNTSTENARLRASERSREFKAQTNTPRVATACRSPVEMMKRHSERPSIGSPG